MLVFPSQSGVRRALLAAGAAFLLVAAFPSSAGWRVFFLLVALSVLLWEAWRVLPSGEKAAIAREIVAGFVERVEQAASVDPRPEISRVLENRYQQYRRLYPALRAVFSNQPYA